MHRKTLDFVVFEMKEIIEGQKTEQDIQDKDSRIYRITAKILDFHLITDKSQNFFEISEYHLGVQLLGEWKKCGRKKLWNRF